MSSFIEVARRLALEAGERILVLRESPLVKERKADHSIVTNADREADEIIREGLLKAFPDHAVLTEESGLHGSPEADYVWVVDPLDGTRAYARGVTGYSVMVGLLKNEKPYAGIVYDPLEGYLFEAVEGEGTFLTRTTTPSSPKMKVTVSVRSDFSLMPVVTSTDFSKTLEKDLRQHLRGTWVPAVNSVGVKVGYVVRREVDIYINHHNVHYWDTCAPQIILQEAGGEITYFDGRPLSYTLQNLSYRHEAPTLATNRCQHAALLQLLQSATPLPS